MPRPLPALSFRDPLLYREEEACNKTETRTGQQALWLAVCLPKLALEVVAADQPDEISVVVEEIQGRKLVHTVSCSAERMGISAGMTLNAACTCCPGLKVYRIDRIARKKRLDALAAWALQFSPLVGLHPPCSFLLEAGGSINYFGGLSAIRDTIARELAERWKHVFYQATAPTPTASLMLAQAGRNLVVERGADLRSALGPLSIEVLPLDDKRRQQLNKTGVRILRDLWRLPSGGLARRFGTDLVTHLDQALGKLPDPLNAYRIPPRFSDTREFSFEIDEQQSLLPAVHELVTGLCDFLQQQDLYTMDYQVHFYHRQDPVTMLHIGLRRPIRQPGYLMLLAETKLSRTKPVAAVVRVTLTAERFYSVAPRTRCLFPGSGLEREDHDIAPLLEQLSTRLGAAALKSITTHADHRPEYACRAGASISAGPAPPYNRRPLWLLPKPRELLNKDGGIYYRSRIHFLMGPERIVTGWWDNHGIQRDYYVGTDDIAGRVWIYHDLTTRQKWYLHGLFG